LKKRSGRSFGCGPALFPIPDRGNIQPIATCEGFLAHAKTCPQCPDIHIAKFHLMRTDLVLQQPVTQHFEIGNPRRQNDRGFAFREIVESFFRQPYRDTRLDEQPGDGKSIPKGITRATQRRQNQSDRMT
jgi:hypothetical protein